MYNKQPPLPSANVPVPYPTYYEHHFDQRDQAVQIGSALANDYSASSYQATPQRKPISENKNYLPPLPPKEKEILRNEGNLPSQSGEVSPFADVKSEPPASLRPGFINVRQSTHTYGDGDAYEGIN